MKRNFLRVGLVFGVVFCRRRKGHFGALPDAEYSTLPDGPLLTVSLLHGGMSRRDLFENSIKYLYRCPACSPNVAVINSSFFLLRRTVDKNNVPPDRFPSCVQLFIFTSRQKE